jgi:ParB-like chromosome segregation protein Spo0J
MEASVTQLQITYLSTSMLAPHPRNARRHSPKQIDQIAISIESFGFNAPILVDANNQVLAGHGRLAAARKLGLEQVSTVRIEHLSERQRRGYMLADNRLGELSTWDETMLAMELEELSVTG